MQRLLSEGLGAAFLLATVVGSGIMADRLAGGNIALALLGNTLPTGAILVVMITVLAPVSGAHFNPAVTLAFLLRKEISVGLALAYCAVQIIGGVIGVWIAHAMFDLSLIQISTTGRSSLGQSISECVATFGLILVILGGLKHRAEAVPLLVGLYITAAYWFTASTSFANPAVTIARTLSETFAGITPGHAPAFVLMQLLGAGLAVLTARYLFTNPTSTSA